MRTNIKPIKMRIASVLAPMILILGAASPATAVVPAILGTLHTRRQGSCRVSGVLAGHGIRLVGGARP